MATSLDPRRAAFAACRAAQPKRSHPSASDRRSVAVAPRPLLSTLQPACPVCAQLIRAARARAARRRTAASREQLGEHEDGSAEGEGAGEVENSAALEPGEQKRASQGATLCTRADVYAPSEARTQETGPQRASTRIQYVRRWRVVARTTTQGLPRQADTDRRWRRGDNRTPSASWGKVAHCTRFDRRPPTQWIFCMREQGLTECTALRADTWGHCRSAVWGHYEKGEGGPGKKIHWLARDPPLASPRLAPLAGDRSDPLDVRSSPTASAT